MIFEHNESGQCECPICTGQIELSGALDIAAPVDDSRAAPGMTKLYNEHLVDHPESGVNWSGSNLTNDFPQTAQSSAGEATDSPDDSEGGHGADGGIVPLGLGSSYSGNSHAEVDHHRDGGAGHTHPEALEILDGFSTNRTTANADASDGHILSPSDGLARTADEPPISILPDDIETAENSYGKPSFDYDQAAAQITRGNTKWDDANSGNALGTPGTVTYAYSTTPSSGNVQINPAMMAFSEQGIAAIGEVADLTFTRIGTGTSGSQAFSDSAEISIEAIPNYVGGWASWSYWYGSGSNLNKFANVTVANGATAGYSEEDDYGMLVSLHELGHSVGLLHPGDYNGSGATSYEAQAEYFEDSRQFSLMSYWSESKTGADYWASAYTGSGYEWVGGYPTNYMLHDIAALQRLYGANMNTRTEDTVYGFNSNTGDFTWELADASDSIIAAVWDAGGIDTLDLSGFYENADVDLREEAFSSFGGLTWNFSIAKGAEIENAIGGYGNDKIAGNALDNVITGGLGNDQLYGGVGADIFAYDYLWGSDTIYDFEFDYDLIDFAAMSDVAFTDISISEYSAGWQVGYGSQFIYIESSSQFAPDSSDFIFAVSGSAPTDIALSNAQLSESAALADIVGNFTASDVDPGDTFSYQLIANPGGYFVIDGASLVVDKPLDYETTDSIDLTVRVTDSQNNSYDENFTIGVNNVAPGAPSDDNATENSVTDGAASDTLVGITASAGDINGGAVTYVLTDNAGGRFKIDANTGVVSVANGALLDSEAASSHAITVQASDGLLNSVTSDFTINVAAAGANVAPGAPSDDNATANRIAEGAATDTLVGITASASDINGDTLSYALTDNAGGRFKIDANTGVVSVANGALLDYESADSHTITVQASDGLLDSTTSDFTVGVSYVAGVTIKGTNGADIINPTTTARGQPLPTSGNDTIKGRKGDDTIDGGAGNDTIRGDEGDDTIDGGAGNDQIKGDKGKDTIDGGTGNDILTGGKHKDTFVFATNFGDDTVKDFDGDLLDISGLGIDAGNFGSRVSIVKDGRDTLITVDGGADPGGTITLIDQKATKIDVDDFILAAPGANAAPGAPSDDNVAENSVAEGATTDTLVGITASASDSDGDAVTYALTNSAGGRFKINANTGVVSVANGALLNYEGAISHTITVQASDGLLNSTTTDFTIGVNNAAPGAPSDGNATANSVAEGAASDTLVGITASAGDINGGAVTYVLTDNAGGRFKIDANTGVVSVANGALLDSEAASSHAITVQASDGLLNSVTSDFTINVAAAGANVAPGAPSDDNATANRIAEGAATDTLVGITASASDINGDTLSYALTDNAGGRFKIDANTGVVSVANGALLDYESADSHTITVQASDGLLDSTTSDFTVGVSYVAGVTIKGTNGADIINPTTTARGQPLPTSGNDTIKGRKGDDTIDGGAGNDTIRGDKGDDTIDGGAGNDQIKGDKGKDTIDGGTGNDILTGGKHKDTFVFATNFGDDTVKDFDGDLLDISGLGIDAGNFGSRVSIVKDGRDTLITVDGGADPGGTITLIDQKATKIDVDDFIFA